jgi:hypothetical protein
MTRNILRPCLLIILRLDMNQHQRQLADIDDEQKDSCGDIMRDLI